jgi:type IV pilus biogenesis protein CpaD/CtpE
MKMIQDIEGRIQVRRRTARRLRKVALLILTGCASPTLAQTQHFPDARETNERLIALYDKAADLCVRNPNRDVEVAVACQSMAIYGMALNERGLCRGKQDEANAFHRWHACEAGSMRFPQVDLPAGFQ